MAQPYVAHCPFPPGLSSRGFEVSLQGASSTLVHFKLPAATAKPLPPALECSGRSRAEIGVVGALPNVSKDSRHGLRTLRAGVLSVLANIYQSACQLDRQSESAMPSHGATKRVSTTANANQVETLVLKCRPCCGNLIA